MSARHAGAGFEDLEEVLVRERARDALRNLEVAVKLVGRRALGQRKQPTCVAHEHRLLGRRGSPHVVEQALDLREPLARRARIPEAHREQHEPPQHIQVEQRVRVENATVVTGPTRALPHEKGAAHQFRRIDEVVVLTGRLSRLEAARPVRFVQLAPETSVLRGGPAEREEAIVDLTREERNVLQVLGRLSLRTQQPFDSPDDLLAASQERAEKLDMRFELDIHEHTLARYWDRWHARCLRSAHKSTPKLSSKRSVRSRSVASPFPSLAFSGAA